MPTQILRVSVNTVIQQNIFKTTLTYENEYGKKVRGVLFKYY